METLKPGTVVDGKYEIVSTIGTGGFGVVYCARQLQLDRIVALKALSGSYADRDNMVRFEREALAISSMQHKNLVAFYGYGVWHDTAYIIMEHLEGLSLDRLLRSQERLTVSRAVNITRQVCEALKCAHAHGVVHRDLKPSNVMLLNRDSSDDVRVIDFGLAKMTQCFGIEFQKLTADGFAVGSVSYMSPEQCITGDVDHRSDLYSAGCILQSCLTGLPPFSDGDSMVIMRAHVNLAPASLASACPEKNFPDGLQEILYKALAKAPDDRYQSADEMLYDLNAIASGTSKRLLSYGARASKPLEEKGAQAPLWVKLVLGAAMCVLVVSGGMEFVKFLARGDNAETSATTYRKAQAIDRDKFETSDDAKPVTVQYEQSLRLARTDHLLNNDSLLRIYNRLAQLYRVRGSVTNQRTFARAALDLCGKCGGGGELRQEATAALIDSFNNTHDFAKATEYGAALLNYKPGMLPDSEVTMGLYCDGADAYFGRGDFASFSKLVDRLNPAVVPEDDGSHLWQRVLLLRGERELIDNHLLAAKKEFDEAVAIKDRTGRTVDSSHDPRDQRLTARLFLNRVRVAVLLGDWDTVKLHLQNDNPFLIAELRLRGYIHALTMAHEGDWDGAALLVNSKLDYIRESPSSAYFTWSFIDVPRFIEMARAAGKTEIANQVESRYNKIFPERPLQTPGDHR